MAKHKKTTDIEKLEATKNRLRAEIREQEKVLDQNFLFIQQNAGSILVGAVANAFLGNVLSPFKKKPVADKSEATASKPFRLKQILNEYLPVVAEVALPFIMQAGVSMLKKKFFRNK